MDDVGEGQEHAEHDRQDDGGRLIAERVTVRPIGRDCEWCGTWVPYSGRGRPAAYCSKTCRNRASELRTIEARLGRQFAAGALRSRPVREVVERTTKRVIERRAAVRQEPPAAPPAAPDDAMAVLVGDALAVSTAREWNHVLEALAAALDQPGPLRARHYDHRHIHRGLMRALCALDRAHPGGLADLG